MENAISPRILLAQAQPASSSGLPTFLTAEGLQYDLVVGAQKALQAERSKHYDLVIADIEFPTLGVLPLVKAMKMQNPESVLLVVAEADHFKDALELMRAGASDVIQMPIHANELRNSLQRVVGAHSSFACVFDEDVTHTKASYEITSAKLCKQKFKLETLERLAAVGKITQSERLQFELGFQEALANSLDHGNLELQSDWKEEIMEDGLDRYEMIKHERLSMPEYSERKIFLNVELDQVKLVVTIKDQGKGFDVSKKQSKLKTQPDCHGRGMFIIEETMDQVKFDKHGTEITLIKFLSKAV